MDKNLSQEIEEIFKEDPEHFNSNEPLGIDEQEGPDRKELEEDLKILESEKTTSSEK